MSIFAKKPDDRRPQRPAPAGETPPPVPPPAAAPPPAPKPAPKSSFMRSGCTLVGDFNGDGSFHCGGDFQGDIDIGGDLIISPGGKAKAELKARRITIEGRLTGNARGTEKVEVGPAGHVEGDVHAPAVQFAEGAFFEGNVEMGRSGGNAEKAGDGSGD